MSNAQLYLAMAIPSAIAFLGIVTNLITFFITNSSLNKRLDRMQDSIDLIQRDHKEFYAKQAVHDSEIVNLKTQKQ